MVYVCISDFHVHSIVQEGKRDSDSACCRCSGWLRLSTKICMPTTIIFIQSHISLISILFSLLKYLLQCGSIIIITTFLRTRKNPSPSNQQRKPTTTKEEPIDYYGHGNDTHTHTFLQFASGELLQNKNIYYEHLPWFPSFHHTYDDVVDAL